MLKCYSLKWKIKKCRKCGKSEVKKCGKRRGHQRYECKICGKKFQNKERKKEKLWKEYSEGKQTQKQIAEKVGKSRKWVNQKLKKEVNYRDKNTNVVPQKIVLVVDTTYFSQFGLMVFRAVNLKTNLLWKIVDHETNREYQLGIGELISDGWEILAIVADGKPGLGKLFPEIPFQLCHFHQFQRITQLISKNPKLEASQELREIMFRLTETDKASFKFWLDEWYGKWDEFLREKTINLETQKSHYTHRRLRTAYFGLRRNLDVLFTFQYHSKILEIPNTTNSLDGYFPHLKNKISVHQGASNKYSNQPHFPPHFLILRPPKGYTCLISLF